MNAVVVGKVIFLLAFTTVAGVFLPPVSTPKTGIADRLKARMNPGNKTTMRICNVFAWHENLRFFLDAKYMVPSSNVINNMYQGLAYKECADFTEELYEGAIVHIKLRYKVEVGSFAPIPAPDSIQLFAVQRDGAGLDSGATVTTHMFRHSASPQVAVIDAYLGPRHDEVVVKREHTSIEHVGQQLAISDTSTNRETLGFGEVWSLTEGAYNVRLESFEHPAPLSQLRKQHFVAVDGECYVIIRCGVEVDHHPAFPETVVVYPEHTELDLHLNAAHHHTTGALVMLTVFWMFL